MNTTETFSSFPPLSPTRFGSGGTTELRCRNAQAMRSRGIIMRALARRMLMDEVVPWKPLPDLIGNQLLNDQQPPQQQQQRGRKDNNNNKKAAAASKISVVIGAGGGDAKKKVKSWHQQQAPPPRNVDDFQNNQQYYHQTAADKRASSVDDWHDRKVSHKSIPIPVYHHGNHQHQVRFTTTHNNNEDGPGYGPVSIQVQHVDQHRKQRRDKRPEITCDVVYGNDVTNNKRQSRHQNSMYNTMNDDPVPDEIQEEKKRMARQLLDQLLPKFPMMGGRNVIQIPVHVRHRPGDQPQPPPPNVLKPFYDRASNKQNRGVAKPAVNKQPQINNNIKTNNKQNATSATTKKSQQKQHTVAPKSVIATVTTTQPAVATDVVDVVKKNKKVAAAAESPQINNKQKAMGESEKVVDKIEVIDVEVVGSAKSKKKKKKELPTINMPQTLKVQGLEPVTITTRLDKVQDEDKVVLKIEDDNVQQVDKGGKRVKVEVKVVEDDEPVFVPKILSHKSTSTEDLRNLDDENDTQVEEIENEEADDNQEVEEINEIEIVSDGENEKEKNKDVLIENKAKDEVLIETKEPSSYPNIEDGEEFLSFSELVKRKLSGRSDGEVSKTASAITPRAQLKQNIPQFYFPRGKPASTSDDVKITLRKISKAFNESGKERLTRRELIPVADACGLTSYWKAAIFKASVSADDVSTVTKDEVMTMWERIAKDNHDNTSKFVAMLAKPGNSHLDFDDFLCLLLDIVECHPGLMFLREAPEFHTRYINTVVARIFYVVNRSWSGQITLSELRKSNFLQVLDLLSQENDINAITDYFSYEHFYVVYCKFWELDTDHDLVVNSHDLSRHANGALPMKLIDRLLCGAVTRWDSSDHRQGKMSYVDFVWFLISEEDKTTPTSIEYWFRCMDLDGDGYISMYEMEYFYEEQVRKLEQLEIEPLPFQDCLCQMIDLVKPALGDKISLRDLKQCKLAKIFFDTFFNIEKYLEHEQKDPFAPQKDIGDVNEPGDWVRYAMEEYELLVAEEHANDQQMDLSYQDETDSLIKEEFAKYGMDDSNDHHHHQYHRNHDYVSSSEYEGSRRHRGDDDNNNNQQHYNATSTAVSNIA